MTRADALVVALSAALVVTSYVFLWHEDAPGSELSVWVSGRESMRLPLALDHQVEIQGAIGTSRIEISRGRARVLDSPGPRKLCVRVGWLERSGESAICLPNEVVLRIEGGTPVYDGINF